MSKVSQDLRKYEEQVVYSIVVLGKLVRFGDLWPVMWSGDECWLIPLRHFLYHSQMCLPQIWPAVNREVLETFWTIIRVISSRTLVTILERTGLSLSIIRCFGVCSFRSNGLPLWYGHCFYFVFSGLHIVWWYISSYYRFKPRYRPPTLYNEIHTPILSSDAETRQVSNVLVGPFLLGVTSSTGLHNLLSTFTTSNQSHFCLHQPLLFYFYSHSFSLSLPWPSLSSFQLFLPDAPGRMGNTFVTLATQGSLEL